MLQIAVGTQGARNRGPRRVAFGKAGRSRVSEVAAQFSFSEKLAGWVVA